MAKSNKSTKEVISKEQAKKLEALSAKKKTKILLDYVKLTQKIGTRPTMLDMKDRGWSKDTITYYFGSLSELDREARQLYPDKFRDVAVAGILDPKSVKKMMRDCRRFVITTAVTDCAAFVPFYESIKNYCANKDAELLILVQCDPAHSLPNRRSTTHSRYGFIDSVFRDEYIVAADMALNSNLSISTIKISAKQIDPITGLGRIGQRNSSFIYASPKQRMCPVAVSNEKLPHIMMTTGAVTLPNYTTSNYMSERLAYIAENDHIMGAVIVELEDDNLFHYRQVQADNDGSFIDLGVRWTADSQSICTPAAFVLGDWHSGETDPTAKTAWLEIMRMMRPKYIVLHDVFNGMSINHHEEKNHILRAKRSMDNQLDLTLELQRVAKDLEELAKYADKIIITKSNHDEFLEQYLRNGKYVEDPLNHKISLKLALAMLDGEDPLKFGVEMFKNKLSNNIRWLTRDEDFKIARIQLGSHGDKGANGSKGNLHTMEAAYGNSVTGHSHTPSILRGAWSVGTSSLLRLSYNSGASSWCHSSILVYPNGSRQIINSINGKWCL